MTPADRARVVIAALGAVLALHLPDARAQSAAAEVLFRDGRTLIKAGRVAEGCDKLVASDRLETSVGTLLNIGDCSERLGRVATAWAAFRKAEDMARRAGDDSKRMLEARRRAARLAPRLPTLTIEVATRIDGLVVRRGDVVVDPAAWNTAVPVDPGSYTIDAEAPGRIAWHSSIPVDAASHRRIAVPELDRYGADPLPAVVHAAPALPPNAIASKTTRRRSGTWTRTRGIAVALAVAGAGAAGGGVYFALRARDLRGQADDLCPTSRCDIPVALHANDQAQESALRANVLFVAGGAAIAGATVLWLVGGPGTETVVTPAIGDGRLGISLAGRF